MKLLPFLITGNHPKGYEMRKRIMQIIKLLKESRGKLEATELEKKLGISRVQNPAMFYKPLAALRRIDLVQAHTKIVLNEENRRHTQTIYELTPELFYHYIKKTFLELLKKEIEMV